MGIFSIFGKKEERPATTADKTSSRKKRPDGSERDQTTSDRAHAAQRTIARATAAKIDAIESEMSSEFVNTMAAQAKAGGPATKPGEDSAAKKEKPRKPTDADSTQQLGTTTGFLLGDGTTVGNAVAPLESAPVIEEAAILYANGQFDMVEQVLLGAIGDDQLGNATLTVWRMLFELYQLTGKREPFDNLSIEFASKFETSPPSWVECAVEPQHAARPESPKSVPTVPFSGRLDGSIVKLLERAQKLAELSKVLRLEFIRVTEVDPIGCGILLSVLKKLQKSDHELILVGALELAAKVRAILQVGRRDETEAPWLLLMEILRLLNLEKEFEEASIDYCVTFEVSPPAFVPPKNKITTALEEMHVPDHAPKSGNYMMPAIIEGKTEQLLQGITAYAAKHNPAVIDCSALNRVDFSATAQLLSGLAPLAAAGNVLEFHHVNQLVAALFNVMGLKDVVQIIPRKL